MSRRDHAAIVIAEVVRRVGLSNQKLLRSELRDAYPFGERKGWPYKAWLAQVKEQVGGMRAPRPDPFQADLF